MTSVLNTVDFDPVATIALSLELALAVFELISSHFSLSQVVRDSDLFRLLGALVFVDVLLLVIWMILHPPSRQVISHSDGAQPVCNQKQRSIENIELVVFRKSKESRFSGKWSASRNWSLLIFKLHGLVSTKCRKKKTPRRYFLTCL